MHSLFRSRPSARRPSGQRRRALSLETLEDRCVPATGYLQTNLTSDLAGMAQFQDKQLVNPWGLVSSPTSPFWVSDNAAGVSTLYNGAGQPQPPPPKTQLVVTVPTGTGSVFPHGTPTGIVFNTTTLPGGTPGFKVTANGKTGAPIFIFATLDGTISGWAPSVDGTHAAFGTQVAGAVYTGLAIDTSGGNTFLYAANFRAGTIDEFNTSFTQVTPSGGFTDPNLPTGYSPFNIQAINGLLYVEYALVDPTTHRDAPGAGHGIVDVFNADGVLQQRLITGSALNSPWGVTLAPSTFGRFGGDLLVGNFGDGRINAYDPAHGTFLGTITDAEGKPFQEDHLWALQFGNDHAAGSSNTLFFTAGINNEKDGLFGSLQAIPKLTPAQPIVPNLANAPQQTFTTVPASNGDQNPYGVAFVPDGIAAGGVLHAGDLLVSNFNDANGTQGAGTTIVRITPDGQRSVFFPGKTGLGLTTALGVLKSGFVLVGNVPTVNGVAQQGSLLILDSNGKQVGELTDKDLLDGPWDLAINDHGDRAQVFVSNVLNGTVTRIDLRIPPGGTPQVVKMTRIGEGYKIGTDKNALVIGPTGLAYDRETETLFVASTGDNAIYAIHEANEARQAHGKGALVVQDDPHLHGPLGLVLAPNGDLIVSNGDAVKPNTNDPNEIVEFTRHGKFVAEMPVDTTGTPGGAFGIALSVDDGVARFAAVDDNSNSVTVWTFAGRFGDDDGHLRREVWEQFEGWGEGLSWWATNKQHGEGW
jgi:uncharacterized protein (TIGR03118 family)